MSFPRYPDYKDSGVEWLGEVPGHWNAVPLWTLYRRTKRTGFAEEELLSVYRDYGVVPKASRDDNFNNASEDLTAYQLVEPGCLAINKMKAWQGSVGISRHRGIVSPAYFIYEPLHSFSSEYMHYLLRSPEYAAAYMMVSKGIRVNQWDLDPQYHSRLPVLLPPIPEQSTIAAFLDRETAKIDALVAEQEKLIELLKEKRQAVISHAVTKGLDPSVPLKDSGIDWLGEVPAHWEVRPLSYGINFQEGPGILAVDFFEDGVPLVRVSGVQGRWVTLDGCNFLYPEKVKMRWEHFLLREGDLVISASASMGTISEVGPEAVGAVPYTGLIRLWPNDERVTRDFIRAIMASRYFFTQAEMFRAGATIQHFGPTHLRQMKIVLPPPAEQSAIVAYLDAQTAKFDTLTAEAQRAIELLKEHRSALISAAVTGKIDVRGLVPAPEAAA